MEQSSLKPVWLLTDGNAGNLRQAEALAAALGMEATCLPALEPRAPWRWLAPRRLPGARVGYVVADQRVGEADGTVVPLADHLAKIKSMVTVNTSPISQAVIGGALLAHDCSLVAANVRERAAYARNLRHLGDGLARRFPAGGPVTWTVPAGGVFVVVSVPFPVDDALLHRSAREYGVLWSPMAHFYDAGTPVNALRLSVSAVTPESIDLGLDRLAALVTDTMTGNATPECQGSGTLRVS